MLARFELDRLDLILVEGFKHAAYPKIEVHRTLVGKPALYPDDPGIIAVATDRSLPGDAHPPALPIEDPRAIADFIVRRLEAGAAVIADPRRELVRYYRLLRVHGCNDSHSGNASVKDGDGFWVTPAGACADTLEPEELIRCPLEGPCPEGASSDAPVHQTVYQRQPRASGVLHSHGPHSVAVSFAGEDFRPIDFEGQRYFERVPVLSVPYDDYAQKAPEAVAEALVEHPLAMVRAHGVYAWGETLNLAYKWTCSLELSAKTYVLAREAASI
jgi:L-fuculose-phosphate aldolase